MVIPFLGRLTAALALKSPDKIPQSARLGSLRQEIGTHPTKGLTPAKLAKIFEEAEGGTLVAQAELARDMEEKSAHLYAELAKRRHALLSVPWSLIAADERGGGGSAAQALEHYLRDHLDGVIAALGNALLPGYQFVELEWSQRDGFWVPQFHPRPAEWFMPDPQDRSTLLLRTPEGGEPLRELGWIAHHHPAKHGDPARAGLVRVLAWPFLFASLSVRDFAEFLDIYGLPMRIGKYRNGTSEAEKNTLMRAVVGLGHNAAGILPEGMAIEFVEAVSAASDPYRAMIGWAERSISKAVLGGTLTSDVSDRGSYAAAKTHNDVRIDILKSDLRLIAETLNRDLIAPLYTLNGQTPPRLVFDIAETEDVTAWGDALPKLAAVGVRIPEPWVRERLGIPEPQDGESILGPASPDGGLAAARQRIVALSRAPEADPLGAWMEQLDRDAAPVIDDWLGTIRVMLDNAEDLESFRDLLLTAFPGMDRGPLVTALAQALAAAELGGRADVAADD